MHWLCIAAAALMAVSACRRPPTEERLYDRAFTLFRRGELNGASDLVKRRVSPAAGSELDWKWRLLEAEIATQTDRAKTAIELLSHPVPFPALEVRRFVDRCVVFSGPARDLARAQEAVDAARRLMTAQTPMDLRLGGDLCQGVIFVWQEKFDEADAILRRVAVDADGASPYHRAAALSTLGYSSLARSRYDAAASFGEQALAAAEKAGIKRMIAASSATVATTYNLLGEFEAALPLLAKAATIAAEIGSANWRQNALGETGNSYYHLGDYGKAAALYAEAYEIASKTPGAQPQKWAGNLASALIEAGQLDEAERWNQRALARSPQDAYYLANSAEIWKLRGDTDRALAECRRAQEAAGTSAALLRSLHAQLASIQLARGNVAAAKREFETALRLIERDQRELSRSTFRMGFLSRLIGYYQGYVAALVEQKDYAGALQIAERSRARVMADRLGRGRDASTFDAKALARKTGSVLVSYWLAPDESYVWVVTPSQIHLEKLPPRREVDRIVQAYRTTVEQSLQDPLTSEAGKRFYETLVHPAAKYIETGSHVILASDGSLHQVNLESAPAPGERPHYWVEDVTISIAPSLALLDTAGAFAGTAPALLIGAPDTVDPRYPALPNAHAEIAAIQGILGGAGSVVREGASATPAAFLRSSPERYSLIHFAAHGESNRENPLESSVILSQSDRGFKLYAGDVIDLGLRAGLVTISGCRSAGARSYSGEGLIGFAWAFLQAGAESVIAGLWEVGDKSTAELMREMYGELARGAAPADALHAAKLAMIRRGGTWKHAREWAAFQTYIRTIQHKKSRGG